MDNTYRFQSPNPNPTAINPTDLPYKPSYIENTYKNYFLPNNQSLTKTDSSPFANFGQPSSSSSNAYLPVRDPSPKPYFQSGLPSFNVNPQHNVQYAYDPAHKSYTEGNLSKYTADLQYSKPYSDISPSKINESPQYPTDSSKFNAPSQHQFDFLSSYQPYRDQNPKPQVESNTSKVSSSQYRFDFQSNLPSFREPSPRPYFESTLPKFNPTSQFVSQTSQNFYEANPKPYLEHSLSTVNAQPQHQTESLKLNVDLSHRLDSLSTIQHAHELSPKPTDEISPSKVNATSQPQFDFQTNLQKLNLVPPKQTDSSPLNIPDDKKNLINLTTYSGAEEWSPSVHFKKHPHNISQSPLSGGQSKGSVSPANVRSNTPKLAPKRQPSTELSISQNASPSRRLNRYGSSERYFETQTEKIMQKGFERSSSKSPLSRNGSLVSSPLKSNKSFHHANSSHSISYSPVKKDSKMNLLKEIRLEGSPNVHNKAKVGLGAVKETLNGVLNERDDMKAIVEELKEAIKEEKALLEKSQENIRFLANYSQCLSKRSGDLDKNTVNTQSVVNRMREEVQKLQEEVDYYNDMNKKMNNQADLENELIKFNQQNTKTLKARLMQVSKERDQTKDKTEVSRHDRKKSMEKHQNAVNTHKNIVNTLENHFQKFAA